MKYKYIPWVSLWYLECMVTSYYRFMSIDAACVSLLCRIFTIKRKQNIIISKSINNNNKKEPSKKSAGSTKRMSYWRRVIMDIVRQYALEGNRWSINYWLDCRKDHILKK